MFGDNRLTPSRLREAGKSRPSHPHIAVQGGPEVIGMRIVADNPVVEPLFAANGRMEQLGHRPGSWIADRVSGGVVRPVGETARLVGKLIDQIPFILRREIEDLRRPMISNEIAWTIKLE